MYINSAMLDRSCITLDTNSLADKKFPAQPVFLADRESTFHKPAGMSRSETQIMSCVMQTTPFRPCPNTL